MLSVLDGVLESGSWDILWLSELDGLHGENTHSVEFIEALAPHRFVRHYGGTGNTACAWLIHSNIIPLLKTLQWRPRSGSLLLAGTGLTDFLAIGLHGRMHTEAEDTLGELAQHMPGSHSSSFLQLCIVGDWNIDHSWTFAGHIGLHSLASGQEPIAIQQARDLLSEFTDQFGVKSYFAERVLNFPGGLWSDACLACPYTRLPIGELAAIQRPSILDFAVATAGSISDSWLDWKSAPADHALVGFDVKWEFQVLQRRKTHWKCIDDDDTLAWLDRIEPPQLSSATLYEDICDLCLRMQQECEDTRTCEQKRAARLPFQIRDMYNRISLTTNESDRSSLKRLAWQARAQWWAHTKHSITAARVKAGKVLQKSRKLHTIESIKIDGGEVAGDEGAQLVQADFSSKWQCNNMHKQEQLNMFLSKYGNSNIVLENEECVKALCSLRNIRKLDSRGLCVSAFKLLHSKFPKQIVSAFSMFINSDKHVCNETILGRVYGKESCHPPADECRAILPLSCMLVISDVIIADRLRLFLDEAFQIPQGVLVGGRPHTQCMDIACVSQFVVEKGLESHSQGSVATCDIRRYYDSIPLLCIARHLLQKGCHPALVVASVRTQLLPSISLALLGVTSLVHSRTSGCLTGSRVAGQIGHLPVLETVDTCSEVWKQKGFKHGAHSVYLCTWIDNVYSFSNSLHKAIDILDEFESHIHRIWGLSIKSTSRSCLVCKGSVETPRDPVKWQMRVNINVLGHHVHHDGGITEDWKVSRKVLWKCFWANAGNRSARKLGPVQRAKLLQRTVEPTLLWKVSRWPVQKTVAIQMDKVQCRMLAMLLPCPQGSGESIDAYCRRRLRNARNVCMKAGMWSQLWCQRVLDWDKHIRRGSRYGHICSSLLNHHESVWLGFQRSQFVPENSDDSANGRITMYAGRTGTRLNIGRPQTRWDEGVSNARRILASRTHSTRGDNALSIGTIIYNACSKARVFAEQFNQHVDL